MAKTRHRLSKHFVVEEFDCHDGTKVAKRDYNGLEYLCRVFLEPLRAKYGRVHVNSGFRTAKLQPQDRRRVAELPHLHDPRRQRPGRRRDLLKGDPRGWHAYLNSIRRKERGGKGGLGLYSSFVHVDIRDTQANWKG
jgi:hypothetical protein